MEDLFVAIDVNQHIETTVMGNSSTDSCWTDCDGVMNAFSDYIVGQRNNN